MSLAVKVPIDIESVIQQLSIKDKIKLVQKLEKQTRRQRWTPLLNRIQKRAAKNPDNGK
jgi:hypothetical protein